MIDRALGVRIVSLYGPLLLALLPLAVRVPPRGRLLGAGLACAWNIPALLLVNVVAARVGWWTFADSPASLFGVPVDLLLGWVVLWGAVPVLLLPRAPLPAVVVLMLVADVALMPLAAPVVSLGHAWLAGEAVALFVALIPSLFFARWTSMDARVGARGALQAMTFAALALWVVPSVVFELVTGSWAVLFENWDRHWALELQLAGLCAVIGVSAVQEFVSRGGGTPIPFDPPKRLVTSGPYAYVANPMQLSSALVFLVWGLVLESWLVALAAPMVVIYGMGFAAMDERSDLAGRFGARWRTYRDHVRDWIPGWRPYRASIDDPEAKASPARLYVAAGCGPCSELARWLADRSPRGLEIVPAELHPRRDLTRVTYDAGDGSGEEEGVAAIARAAEHIHLGWALLGWAARLPGVRPALQLLVDASGGEPRLIRRGTGDTVCVR